MTDMEFIKSTVQKVNANQHVSKNDVAKALQLVHVVRENNTADCSRAELMQIGGLLATALSKPQ